MTNIDINIFRTIDGLSIIAGQSFFFIIISIIYICMLSFALHEVKVYNLSKINASNYTYINSNNSNKLNLFSSDLLITNLFISIVGLIPFIYIWFAENVISRYFLITLYLFKNG